MSFRINVVVSSAAQSASSRERITNLTRNQPNTIKMIELLFDKPLMLIRFPKMKRKKTLSSTDENVKDLELT